MIWNTIGAVIGRICNIIFPFYYYWKCKYVLFLCNAHTWNFVRNKVAVFVIIAMYIDKDYSLLGVGKILGYLLIGILFLMVTLPSLKYVVLKEYDVVSGICVIEIDSSGRSSEADFKMLDTDEMFFFQKYS